MGHNDWPFRTDSATSQGAVSSVPRGVEAWRQEGDIARWLRAKRSILSPKVAMDVLRIADLCVMIAAGWIAFLVYPAVEIDAWRQYSLVAVLGGILVVNVLQLQGAYHLDRIRQPLTRLGATAGAIVVTAAMLIAVAFITKLSANYSRGWVLLWLTFALGGVIGMRLTLYLALVYPRSRRTSWLQRNVAIVGSGPDAERLIAHLAQVDREGIRLIGLFEDRHQEGPSAHGGCPVRGTIADLCELCRDVPVDTIYVVMPLRAEAPLLEALNQLQCLPVDIRLVVAPLGFRFLNRRVSYVHQLPMIHVADRPLGDWGRLIKRIEDFVVATVALTLLTPVMLVIAVAVAIDSPGPVLFRQKRYGFNNQLIEVLKFRTMRYEQCDANGSTLTMRNDPRVTRLGRLLRQSSLDELPQLINVLRGEMSIVGPRPHATEAKAANRLYQDIVRGYAARHKVKPGLTGWAQVNGWRGPTDTEDQIIRRVEYDLWYLENWSIFFDIKIIIVTIFVGLFGKNAY